MQTTITNKVTDRILNYLKNGDEVDRCYAAKTLGNLKVKKATPVLIERLRDEDIDVCIDAITALGKINELSSLPLLLESLENDPDADVKLAVTESLAKFQSKDTIDVLLKLAEERPEEMVFDENEDWDSWWDLQEKAIVILGEMKVQKAFSVLKTILEDEYSQDIEAIILKAMAKIGGDADEYLIDRLNGNTDSGNSEINQRRTATALGFSKSKETLQALGRALTSKSADTRENVIYALGRRKASQYIKVILMSLRASHNNVKRAALEVITDLATESQINQELDFNQIAQLLVENDNTLETAILSFFQQQHKISPIFNRLTENSQQLIRECLNNSDDSVIIQASQLLALAGDTQSIENILNIVLAESNSVWVRKETILALGNLLNSVEQTSVKQNVLLNLKQLVHHQEQAIRHASIQSLLTLSNSSLNLVEDELPPITILLATLKGEQFDLNADDSKDEKNSAVANDCNSCPKSSGCSESADVESQTLKQTNHEDIAEKFAENNTQDSSRLISSNEDQPMQAPMSTLDAIAMDNVEIALSVVPETAEQKAHDKETGPFISEDLPEEMDEFVAIMRENFARGKKITRRKVDTFSDARHICARLLAENVQTQYDEIIVNALAECLNDDDEFLRQEATEALSLISLKNPLIAGLSNTFGKLITLLDSKDRDMRISCLRAISHSGNRAALPHLLDYLSDEDYMVRLEAINGLSYILTNKANLTKEQIDNYMVLDDISDERVIAAIFDCLDDQNYSVSMATIEVLTELQQTNAIEQFIDVALKGEGQSARPISKLLKKLDLEKTTELLLHRLDNVPGSSSRRYVMEMLEEVVTIEDNQLEVA
ncbi:MAG: HEAT repeat domain-containing protein [Pseudomonadota bacterium]